MSDYEQELSMVGWNIKQQIQTSSNGWLLKTAVLHEIVILHIAVHDCEIQKE